jgi:protein-L-isoaspartate(D-aspartate) O-methyltransferase
MKLSDSLNEKLINLMSNLDYLDEDIKRAFIKMKRHYFLKSFYLGGFGSNKKIILDDKKLSEPNIMKIIYKNSAIPTILENGELISSISQPSMNAYILKMMLLEEHLKILEIGSGTGWLSALISECIKGTGKIIGIEMNTQLAQQSKETIQELGIKNIEIINKDGSDGYIKEAPYDRIVFTAASNDIPEFVYEQLKIDGLVLLPLLSLGWNIFAVLKKTEYGLISQNLSFASFVPLQNKVEGGYKTNEVNLNRLKNIKLNRKIKLKEVTKDYSNIKNANFKLFLFLSDNKRAVNFVLSDSPVRNPMIIEGFGLYDADLNQYCIIKDKFLYSYGEDDRLLKKLLKIINTYIKHGKPSVNRVNFIILEESASADFLKIPSEKVLSETNVKNKKYLIVMK